MANKAMRVIESIKDNAGSEIYENINKLCGSLNEKATPNSQSKHVKSVLIGLKNNYGPELVKKL